MTSFRAKLTLIVLAIVSASVSTAPAPSPGCPVGWVGWQEHCYYFSKGEYEDVGSWYEAQARCEQLAGSGFRGNLASIHSYDENQFIYDTFQSMEVYAYSAYIGFRQIREGGLFSWNDGTPVTYTRWISGYPFYDSKECAQMPQQRQDDGYTGEWFHTLCSGTLQHIGYVCKTQQATSDPTLSITGTTPEPLPTLPDRYEGCPPNWIGWQSNCYYYTQDENDLAGDFEHAQELCKKRAGPDFDGNLTSVLSQEENDFLYHSMYRRGIESRIFIGLRQYEVGEDKPFFWVDGSEVNYTNWGTSPSGTQAPYFYHDHLTACAMFYGDYYGGWIDQAVTNSESYIAYACKTKRATTTSATTSSTPTPTLSTISPACISDGESCSADAEESHKMCCSNVCSMGVCSSTP